MLRTSSLAPAHRTAGHFRHNSPCLEGLMRVEERTAAGPAARPPRRSWPRRHWRVLAIGGMLLLVVAYVVPTIVVVRSLTVAKRKSLTSSPAALGLQYEDISFPSRVDRLTLRGWWIP